MKFFVVKILYNCSLLCYVCEMLDTTTDMAIYTPPTYGPTHQLKLQVVPHGSAPAAQL